MADTAETQQTDEEIESTQTETEIDIESIVVKGRDDVDTEDYSTDSEGKSEPTDAGGDGKAGNEASDAAIKKDATTVASGDAPKEKESTTSFYSRLPGDLGLEFKSDEDVVTSLKEYAKLKSQPSEIDSLSDALKTAIQIEKSGGDAETYLRVLSVDPEKIEPKEALWQKFIRDKQGLYSQNAAFAKKTFEREFNAKFGVLNQTFEDALDKEDYEKKNAEDIEYAKLLLEHESSEARGVLKKERDSFFEASKKTQTQGTSKAGDVNDQSAEDVAKYSKEYSEAVSKSLKDFKGFALSVGEKESFNVGFDESEIKIIEDYMKTPLKFLQEIGVDKDKLDTDKLRDAVAAHVAKGKMGKMVFEHAKGLAEQEIVEKKVIKPGKAQSSGGSAKGDFFDQLAEKFESKRNY